MKKLRVLFIASGFFKVGDYFRYKAMAETLASMGHYATVLTGDMRPRVRLERETTQGVTWLYPPYFGGVPMCERLSDYLPETKLPYDILYRVYFMLTRAGDYNVVHGFHVGFNTYLPLLAARWPARRPALVFDWCDLWDNGILRPPTKGLFKKLDYSCSVALETLSTRHADGVTVNNKYLAGRAAGFGVPPERIRLIRCGAYSDQIKPVDKQRARARLNLDPSPFLLGFSGFFHPDTELLLEAFARVRARAGEGVKLLFVGSIHPGLTRAIERHGLGNAVIYVGRVEHERMGDYLSACDLLLLPFTNRPVNLGRWPFKLGDYLSAGRPVVAGGYGDLKDFFDAHPDIGITCEGDAVSFANAILAMMNDPARRARAEQAARRVAVDELRWDDCGRQLERFYLELLDEKAARSRP